MTQHRGTTVFDWLWEGESEPIRWYHFIAPLTFVAFVIFCVGFTLWSLFA